MKFAMAAARWVVGPLLLLAIGGCATLPPPEPIPSMAAIAGQWPGTIQFGRGFNELFYLTVNPDGSIVGVWGPNTRFGRVDLTGARPRFSLYIWSGDLQYLVGGGQRTLVLKDDFDTFYAQVSRRD
jgi:hypothetical protein